MSRTRIKICGNTNPADLAYAILCGADAVGFITDVPVRSPRKIDTETAKELIKQVPVFVDSVLVIMPDNLGSAMALIRETHPTCVQIHNDLPVSELAEISKTVKLIKTIAVPEDAPAGTSDHIISRIDALTGIADAILLDTSISSRTSISTGAKSRSRSGEESRGESGARSGGTGKVHDWGISAEIVERSRLPIILAGGLTPDNAADAIRKVHPYAVDTASGVETDRKRKPDKVRRFIRECMMADGAVDDD
ncbi:phosphoribosylanthranilate isomerase [Methanosarcinales archaeon]|nr:MAG: phosphoribosylanthranilate isomerase [Methanosarcinales archaeon]